jgi:hypothetical protein
LPGPDFVKSFERGARFVRLFFSKLGFIHRRLWGRDGFYRIALLFGPAPLVGAGLAAIAWGCIVAVQTRTYQPPAWAHYTPATSGDNGSPDAPHPISPARPLPPLRGDGSAIGYDAGWSMTANSVTISPTMEADVNATPITGFTIDEPTATMARILDGRPKDKLFVGVASGFLVIREANTYGIFPRFERPAGPLANCLVRLSINGRRITSNQALNVAQRVTQDYPPTWFEFQPGLYRIGWAFGCWHGNEMSDLGQISVMLVEPGGRPARPLQATDIVR